MRIFNHYKVEIFLFRMLFLCMLSVTSHANLIECDFLEINNAVSKEISITNFGVLNEIKTLKFGFNIELARTVGANSDFSHRTLNRVISALDPDALRYPGGTPANYFNWEKERIDESLVKVQANNHIKRLVKKIKNENKGGIPPLSLENYLIAAKNQGFTPFIVLNMFDSNVQIISAINKVKALRRDVVYWELGNEVAFKSYHKMIKMDNDEQWSASIYAHKINEISKYIKNNYSQDRIGVVASEIAEWRNINAVPTKSAEIYRAQWDEALISSMKYVDAVIVHPYILSQKNKLGMNANTCKGRLDDSGKLNNFLWSISNISYLPDLYLTRLEKRFPNKRIWLTEFGIIGEKLDNIPQKIENQNGERVLLLASWYIAWLKKFPTVEVILTHGLFDGYDWAHTIYPDLSLTANGVAYKFTKDFLSGVEKISPLKLNSIEKHAGIDRYSGLPLNQVYGVSGVSKKNNIKSMYLVNTLNYSLILKMPWKVMSKKELSFRWDEVIEPGKFDIFKPFLKEHDLSKNATENIVLLPRSMTILKSK